MNYRTKTYIAADFDHDKEAVNQLYKWKNDNHLSLDFHDAHEITQSRDTSLYCTIKGSLSDRLNRSKTFVLIVGKQTNTLTKGSCQYCSSYNSWTYSCAKGYSVDYRSYIKYECEKAYNDYIKGDITKIVVLYKNTHVDKSFVLKF